LLPERAEALVYVYTNSKLLAKSKLNDESRWYEVNLDVEEHDVRDADEAETSHQSTETAPPDVDGVDKDDDVESSPSKSLQDGWVAPNHTFDFEDEDEVGEKVDDLESIADMSPTRKTHGDVNCDDIHASGPTPIIDETVMPSENNVVSDTNDGTMTSNPVTENVVAITEDKGPLSGNARQSLFQFSAIEAPKVKEKSSQGLLILSKEKVARMNGTKDDGKSSDSDNVPLANLGLRKGAGGAWLRAKEAPNVPSKRKSPMLPFHREKPKNPLEAPEQHERFKLLHPSVNKLLKRRIKQEDDPTESSGAEVPDDSDYALPTDADE
jgi:hypothetical protein